MSTSVAIPARTRTPFRADHVCIRQTISKQESIGLRAATDAEYRRAYWHFTVELESSDDLKHCLDAASKFLPLEQLALSPHAASPALQKEISPQKTSNGGNSNAASKSRWTSGAPYNATTLGTSTLIAQP